MIYSLASQRTPAQVALMLIDLKRVEFARFAELPHLIREPSLDIAQALETLRFTRRHIDERYEALTYNPTLSLAHTVLFIDEFADLVLRSNEARDLAVEIGALGRAARVHVVAATQRPSADVISGLILVNFLTRIGLQVPTAVNSRVILDQNGAERLLGKGDGLLSYQGQLTRFQGAFVSEQQLVDLVVYARIRHMKARGDLYPPKKLTFLDRIRKLLGWDVEEREIIYGEVEQ
jgi:S-DNA-T family DNA segregation ATPase FtsK/SpoIIIE